MWTLTWVSLKYVLPTFPSLVSTLGGDKFSLKLSIILFLAVFAISQPFWAFFSEYTGRRKILLISTIFGLCAGFMMPESNAGAMTIFPKMAGPASAIMTLCVFGLSSLLSAFTISIDPSCAYELFAYFASCMGLTIIVGMLFIKRDSESIGKN